MQKTVLLLVFTLTGCYGAADAEISAPPEDNQDAGQEQETTVMRDACIKTGITNMLLGSCFWEQCRNGEKSLYPKIAGVNCVYIPADAINDEFVIGSCNEFGVCGK